MSRERTRIHRATCRTSSAALCASSLLLAPSAAAQEPCDTRYPELLLELHGVAYADDALEVLDLDLDGELDLLVAAGTGLDVLRGLGHGRFAPAEHFDVGTPVWSLASGDFDLDGDLDVVLGGSQLAVTFVLRGEPGTLFGAPESSSCAFPLRALEAGDFDGDGALDLVGAAVADARVVVLWNDGAASYGAIQILTSANDTRCARVADWNGDGIDDFAAPGGPGVEIRLGAPSRTFVTSASLAASGTVTAIVTADFNEDGWLDLGAARGSYGSVRTFAGDGTGAFGAPLDGPFIPSWSFAQADLESGDYDRDGHVDLLASLRDTYESSVLVLLGDGTRSFTVGPPLSRYGLGSITWRDLDQDGDGDFAAAAGRFVHVELDRGTGIVAPATIEQLAHASSDIDLADLDQDGLTDILVSARASSGPLAYGSIATYRNEGTTGFVLASWDNVVYALDLASALRDLDGDGDPERLFTRFDGRIAVARGLAGTAFGSDAIWFVASDGVGFAVEDLDGDGAPDVASASRGARQLSVLRGDGAGGFASSTNHPLGLPPTSLYLADVDADGDFDAVMDVQGRAGWAVALNDGHATFGTASVHFRPLPYEVREVADWDGDGRADVLATLESGLPWPAAPYRLFWSRALPTGAFTDPARLLERSGPVVRARDVDGDGNLDLLTTGAYDGLAIHFTDGERALVAERYHLAPHSSTALESADIDGDGRLDLALLGESSRRVALLLQHAHLPGFYCAPTASASGCEALLQADGCARISGGESFEIRASEVAASSTGGLFYGFGRASQPFLGAMLCVQPPLRRTPNQATGGTGGCTGALAVDFNARIQSGVDPALAAGVQVHAQMWFLDPAPGQRIGLSDAVEFTVLP